MDTALVDWDGERATLRDALAGTEVPASRDNVGVTLQHQALWSRVFVTAGVRFEHNDSFGNATVPRVAAAWYLREGSGNVGATRLSASAGRGIKEPTVLQSFSPSPFFLGNPDLLPERTRAVEFGVEQRLASDRVRLNFAWFDNRYQNIISLKTDPVTFQAQDFNIGLTTARGAELSADVVPRPGSARSGATRSLIPKSWTAPRRAPPFVSATGRSGARGIQGSSTSGGMARGRRSIFRVR